MGVEGGVFCSSWFHGFFALVGSALKILLQWAKWNWCSRAYITVMPKRGHKGAVVEDAEEPKTGKRMKWAPLPRGSDRDVYNYLAERKYGPLNGKSRPPPTVFLFVKKSRQLLA